MTRYLLDTNIISNVTKPSPSQSLMDWLAEQLDDSLYVSSLTVAEIWCGILEKPVGRKRDQLEEWFTGPEGPRAIFAGRILPFDERAGLVWARLMARSKSKGRPRSAMDSIIAATAIANDCIMVTDNEKHFEHIETINPLRNATH